MSLRLLPILMASTLIAPSALAEGFEPPAPVTSSPYAYAKSGAKGERARAAGSAGAKVIGGEVSAEGAWPWQVALLIAGVEVASGAPALADLKPPAIDLSDLDDLEATQQLLVEVGLLTT